MHENNKPRIRPEWTELFTDTGPDSAAALKAEIHFFLIQKKRAGRPDELWIIFLIRMKISLLFLLIFSSFSAISAVNTEISCELKRDEWEKMTFEFRFLTPKRALTAFHFRKGEVSGTKSIPVSAIHQSVEARYVGLKFLGEEKLVFILLSPIFDPENIGIPMGIEVVSSIYGPLFLKCKATK